MNDIDIRRRSFLKTSLGAAAVAIAPGILLFDTAHGKPQPASAKVRWGMLIDTAQCKEGCNDCVNACNKENGLSGGTSATARPISTTARARPCGDRPARRPLTPCAWYARR